MKTRTSSRITALVLALMMIVPLLSIPTFADDATTTEQHYEFIKDFSTTNYLGGYTTKVDSDGDGTADTTVNLDGITLPADGTGYGDHTADDKVFVVDATVAAARTRVYMESPQNSVSWSTDSRHRYCGTVSNNAYVVLQADYYFPKDTKAVVKGGPKSYFYLNAAGSNEGNGSNLELYQLYSDGEKVTLSQKTDTSTPASVTSTTDAKTISVDKWFTLTTVIDTATGNISQYVDGVLYYEYQFTHGAEKRDHISILSYTFSFSTLKNSTTGSNITASGSYAVDNAMIYTELPEYAKPSTGEGEGGEGGGTTDPEPEPEPEPETNDATLPSSTIAGTNFANGSLDGVTNGSETGMSVVEGTDYGKANDSVFVVNAAMASTKATYLSLPQNATGFANGLNIIFQSDYYIPSTTTANINVTAPNWTSTCPGATGHTHRVTNLTLYRLSAANGKLTIPAKDHNGVPAAATLVAESNALPMNEWFTITLVINTEAGELNLYWTSAAGVTKLMYTYYAMDRSVNHTELNFTTLAFSQLNAAGTGSYAVDNVCVYTDETQRPGYSVPTDPDEGGDTDPVEPETPAFPPASAVIGTEFNDTTYLGDYANNSAATVPADGAAYGKDATDKVFAVDASATSGRVYMSIPANTVTLLDGTTKAKYVGVSSGHTYVILQADYYFKAGTVATVFGGAKNMNYEVDGTVPTTLPGNINLYQIKADGTTVSLVQGANCQGGIPPTDTTVWHKGADGVATLPVGDWFTLSTVINTETGWVELYVNGVLYVEYQFTWGGSKANPITPTKIDVYSFTFSQNEVAGSGSYAVDNAVIYTDVKDAPNYADYKAYDPTATYTHGALFNGKYYATDDAVKEACGKNWFYGDHFYAINSGIIETLDKTQIRLSADTADTATSGIRFATLLDTDQVAFLESYKDLIASVGYGTLIVPKDYHEDDGSNLTFDAQSTYLKVAATPGKYYEGIDDDAATTHFVGSIVAIKDYNTAREFTGRGYLQIELTTGETITVYSDTWHSASIKKRAADVLGDYSTESIYYNMLKTWATWGDPQDAE